MFCKLIRKLSPNPLDQILKKANRKKQTRFLLFWNRGLGDIALGLYGIVQRIHEKIPEAEVTFLIRKDLQQGFGLFKGVSTIIAPHWERKYRYYKDQELKKLQINKDLFDVIIDWPDPSYWIKWQRGKIIPKLYWQNTFNKDTKDLGVNPEKKYIAVQPLCETTYGLWRNLPMSSWEKLFEELSNKGEEILLLGYLPTPKFSGKNILDLRGKTDLYQLLSIMQTNVKTLIVPDSGILSMTYYLNKDFPIKVLSLWADPNHGILKQNVSSPNRDLLHIPLIAKDKDLSKMSIKKIITQL